MLLNAPKLQEAVGAGQTVARPPPLSSEWGLRLKRASGKRYLNPMDCNSFQNACNFMTWGSLHKTALQTPPCFAIRHPRLT